MNVLLFIGEGDAATADRLLNVVESVVPSYRLEVVRTHRELISRLIKLPKDILIHVLLAQDRDQLLDLIALRSAMEGIRTILVTPDEESVTLALGHLLRPALITTAAADTQFANIAAVLAKCLGAYPERTGRVTN
jgi:hypothetical protein